MALLVPNCSFHCSVQPTQQKYYSTRNVNHFPHNSKVFSTYYISFFLKFTFHSIARRKKVQTCSNVFLYVSKWTLLKLTGEGSAICVSERSYSRGILLLERWLNNTFPVLSPCPCTSTGQKQSASSLPTAAPAIPDPGMPSSSLHLLLLSHLT